MTQDNELTVELIIAANKRGLPWPTGYGAVETIKVLLKQVESQKEVYRANAEYLVGRLESILAHINSGNHHMAAAKLLADISANSLPKE